MKATGTFTAPDGRQKTVEIEFEVRLEVTAVAGKRGGSQIAGSGSVKATGQKSGTGAATVVGSGDMGG